MTLQASGPMSTADINVELGQASDAALSTGDSNFLELSDTVLGAPVNIPQDMYGKTLFDLGTVQATYNMIIGEPPTGFNFAKGWNAGVYFGAAYGNLTSILYRSAEVVRIISNGGNTTAGTRQVTIDLEGSWPLDYVTGFEDVFTGRLYTLASAALNGAVTTYQLGDTFAESGFGPYTSADLGTNNSIRLYGV